jgi:GT2 family glycosyltransferase
VWDRLQGWDAEYFTGLYWEDNDLCYRATKAGFLLIQRPWPVWHFNNYTSNRTPGAKDNSAGNMARFLERANAQG